LLAKDELLTVAHLQREFMMASETEPASRDDYGRYIRDMLSQLAEMARRSGDQRLARSIRHAAQVGDLTDERLLGDQHTEVNSRS
jgi:DNA invertase Pin-like site-specific DNA recombinase